MNEMNIDNVIGKTIENSYAVWTVLGVPVFSHTKPGTGEKVYKIRARCEPKVATYPTKDVDLHLDEDDLTTISVQK